MKHIIAPATKPYMNNTNIVPALMGFALGNRPNIWFNEVPKKALIKVPTNATTTPISAANQNNFSQYFSLFFAIQLPSFVMPPSMMHPMLLPVMTTFPSCSSGLRQSCPTLFRKNVSSHVYSSSSSFLDDFFFFTFFFSFFFAIISLSIKPFIQPLAQLQCNEAKHCKKYQTCYKTSYRTQGCESAYQGTHGRKQYRSKQSKESIINPI